MIRPLGRALTIAAVELISGDWRRSQGTAEKRRAEGSTGMMRTAAIAGMAVLAQGFCPAHADETQAEIAAPLGTVVMKVHAVGAQIYECKPDGRGGLAWTFREPIATLLSGDKTVPTGNGEVKPSTFVA